MEDTIRRSDYEFCTDSLLTFLNRWDRAISTIRTPDWAEYEIKINENCVPFRDRMLTTIHFKLSIDSCELVFEVSLLYGGKLVLVAELPGRVKQLRTLNSMTLFLKELNIQIP